MATKELILIDEAQQAVLKQKTPPNLVAYRQGPGGKMLAYLPHDRVTRMLNDAFHFQWSFTVNPLPEFSTPEEVCVQGKLIIHLPDGSQIVKEAFGGQSTKIGRHALPPGDALKGAQSDALRKAASLLGIGLDLYGADEPAAPSPPENNGRFRTFDDLLFSLHAEFGLSEGEAKAVLKQCGHTTFKVSRAMQMYEDVHRLVTSGDVIQF